MPDARDLSDRELLLLTFERVEQVHGAVFGPPSLSERLAVVETRVEERTTSKKATAGLSGLVAAIVVGVVEALRAGTK